MAQFFMPRHPELDVYIYNDIQNFKHVVTIKWKNGLTLIAKDFPEQWGESFSRHRYMMTCWINEQFDAYNSWR